MKKILILLLACIYACHLSAQTVSNDKASYTIYSNSGVVMVQSGKDKVQLKNGMKLVSTSIVTIPAGGRLVLVDEESRQRFTITESGSNSIANFLKGSKKKSLAAAEFNYLKKQLAGVSNSGPLDGFGTIDRRTELDSLMRDTTTSK